MEILYSLDMVRLKTYINIKGYNDSKIGFDNLFYPFLNEPKVKHYKQKSVKDWLHNFVVTDYNTFGEKCSFWIGVEHNSPRLKIYGMVDVVIEYNPSKCNGSEILDYILSNVYFDNFNTELISFDLAIDIPCNILDICFDKNNRRSFRLVNNGSDDKTYYFGKRSTTGASKIYNKKRESKLNYELTRYEITYKIKQDLHLMSMGSDCRLYILEHLMPLSAFYNYQMDLSIDGTDRVLIMACIEHPQYLSMLGRKKKEKIKTYLEKENKIEYDFKKINELIFDFASSFYSEFIPYLPIRNIKNAWK